MEYERLIAYFDGDSKGIEAAGQRALSVADAVEQRFKNLKATISVSTTSGGRGGDSAMRQAQAEINRYRTENARAEREVTRQMEREARSQSDARIREARRASTEIIREAIRAHRSQSETAEKTKSVFASVLGGSFFGNLGASAASSFLEKISTIPSFVRSIVDDAVKIASERQNAALGLKSTAEFKGVKPEDAQAAVQNFRLVKAGIVDVSEATVGLKNLLASGFSLDKAIVLFERFSDSASFGKQAALGYGQAVAGATEGIKNQNSMLVDNAGVTKNISVILKERGFEMQDLSDKQKGANALEALYQGLLKETAAQVGDADKLTQTYTGTVASLDQAQKNLYASVGSIINQNPEVIAMLRLWTSEINGVTGALEGEDRQQAETFGNFISWLAKETVKLQNFGEFTIAVFKDIFNSFARVTTGYYGMIELGARATAARIEQVFDRMTVIINGVIGGVNSASGPLGGPQIPMIERDTSQGDAKFAALEKEYEESFARWSKYFEVEKGWFQKSNQALISGADRLTEYQFLIDETRRKLKESKDRKVPSTGKDTDVLAGDKKKGRLSTAGLDAFASDRDMARYQQGLRGLSDDLRASILAAAKKYSVPENLALAQIFSESSFKTNAKSPFNKNVGSSAYGLTQVLPATATRVLDKKTSGADLFNKETALTAWGKYMTKLFNEFGDWELAVFAYHNGEGAARKFAAALDSGDKKRIGQFAKSNPKGIAYAKKISALSGLDKNEQFGVVDLGKQSNELTKEAREKSIRQAIEFYKIVGLIPTGEMLSEFQSLMADEARKAGTAQPTKETVASMFAANALSKAKPIDIEPGTVSSNIQSQQTEDEKHISNLRISLGLEADSTGEATRYTKIVLRERNLMEEVSALLEDQALSRREATVQAQIDYRVALRRNTAEEAALGFIESRAAQLNQVKDVERDIAILKQQNADSQFVEQRRLLLANNEQYSLQQDRDRLQDQLANGDRNQSLEIEVAHLRDLVSLRQLETDRIIEGNRTLEYRLQVTMAQIPSYSEIFKSSIADLPNSVADMLGNVAQQWDGTWSGLFNSVKQGFAQMLADMAQQYLRAAISQLIGKLVGSLIGAVGGSIGGGSGFSGFGGAGANHGLPGFADGGSPPVGRVSLVGERGPELFIPKQAGTILTNEQSREMLNGGGRRGMRQTSMNVTVVQNFKTPRSLTAQKSVRQQSQAALMGASRALRQQDAD